MRDYVKSRPAKVGEKLRTQHFHPGTVGFAAPEDAIIPPSFTPRRLAAARAAFVLAEIIPASSSATAPICCNRNLPVAPSSSEDRQTAHQRRPTRIGVVQVIGRLSPRCW
jgi:hypothetical protein